MNRDVDITLWLLWLFEIALENGTEHLEHHVQQLNMRSIMVNPWFSWAIFQSYVVHQMSAARSSWMSDWAELNPWVPGRWPKDEYWR